jgi:signal peptidase II
VLTVDQVTKSLAQRDLAGRDQPTHLFATLYLNLTYNPGAAFGLGRGVTPIVETVVVLLVAGLLAFGRRAAGRGGALQAVGLGLLVGGAVGNLADRVVRHNHGAVIDFIDAARVGTHEYWPVFNVADSAIVVGAAILALGHARASASPPAERVGS